MIRISFSPTIQKQLLGLLVLALLLSACSEAGFDSTVYATPQGAQAVDPLFREFYEYLGGIEVLGPAISPGFDVDSRRYQYIQAGCMQYDPSASESKRFGFFPLGLEMNITEPAVPPPDDPDELYVDGHVIYKGFVEMYHKLGGARYVGHPITEVHYNPDKKRYEQYFANLGFFWLESDPPGVVRLLAYGSWKCAEYCASRPPQASEIDLPEIMPGAVDKLFVNVVSRLGPTLTGLQLTPPFQAEDGLYEQIFVSLVIAVDIQNPTRVIIRPLPLKIGIQEEAPVLPSGVEGMVFWPTDGERGHNVPQAFVDYILSHGGQEISGHPITELFLTDKQVWRQCFANYCLDYQMGKDVPEALRIRPAPFGYTYKELFYRSQDTKSFVETQDLHEVSLQVWERHPFVSSKQVQKIGASIFENNQPLRNVEPVLILTMPDGSEQSYYFPPTGDDGQTIKRLNPIIAPNGTLIPYQVCISSLTGERFCVKDSFVIWNNE